MAPHRDPLGSIAKTFVDSDSSTVSYVLVKFDQIGFDEAYFPIPWMALNYNAAVSGYQTHLVRRQLLDAPKYSASSGFGTIRLELEAAVSAYYGRCYLETSQSERVGYVGSNVGAMC